MEDRASTHQWLRSRRRHGRRSRRRIPLSGSVVDGRSIGCEGCIISVSVLHLLAELCVVLLVANTVIAKDIFSHISCTHLCPILMPNYFAMYVQKRSYSEMLCMYAFVGDGGVASGQKPPQPRRVPAAPRDTTSPLMPPCAAPFSLRSCCFPHCFSTVTDTMMVNHLQ